MNDSRDSEVRQLLMSAVGQLRKAADLLYGQTSLDVATAVPVRARRATKAVTETGPRRDHWLACKPAVLRMHKSGMPQRQIARTLHVSERAVSAVLKGIL